MPRELWYAKHFQTIRDWTAQEQRTLMDEAYLRRTLDKAGVPHRRGVRAKIKYWIRKMTKRGS